MDDYQIDAVVAEVNAFVMRHLWMDFSVWNYRGIELEVSGSIDESYWSDLRVVFVGICWASIRFQGWHSDTSRPVLRRVSGPEAYAVNEQFEIEQGHHIFQFIPSHLHQPMWVAAQGLKADFTRIEFEVGK